MRSFFMLKGCRLALSRRAEFPEVDQGTGAGSVKICSRCELFSGTAGLILSAKPVGDEPPMD